MNKKITIEPLVDSRYYNKIEFFDNFIIKSSNNTSKLQAEMNFFELIPDDLKIYFPNYLGATSEGFYNRGYSLERLLSHDLGYMFVNKFDQSFFYDVLSSIKEYFNCVPKKETSAMEFKRSVSLVLLKKLEERVLMIKDLACFDEINKQFYKVFKEGIEPFSKTLIEELGFRFSKVNSPQLWLSHGDLCFSNIFFEKGRLLLVDPRGVSGSFDELFIPAHYDFAKLSQCIFGGYDFCSRKMTRVKEHEKLKEFFVELLSFFDIELKLLRLVECSHFISMIPLHKECETKMKLFAAQAINSYRDFESL